MNATDIAAWWGGGIATVVLAWDIYKWKRRGPHLTCEVLANMKVLGRGVPEEGTFVTVRVRNRGDAATTLESMYLAHYHSSCHRILGRTDHLIVIRNPGITCGLPALVEPGSVWDGRALQDESLVRLANKGQLECRVYYSHARRPIAHRIGPIVRRNEN